jgi:NADP-dependent 3-hydroxy acid dehydrogenase YdfG
VSLGASTGTTASNGLTSLRHQRRKSLAPDAIARAIRFALEQPDGVDVNEIVVRPTVAGM